MPCWGAWLPRRGCKWLGSSGKEGIGQARMQIGCGVVVPGPRAGHASRRHADEGSPGAVAGEEDEEDDDDSDEFGDEEGEYMTEDELDPDDMTYEVGWSHVSLPHHEPDC